MSTIFEKFQVTRIEHDQHTFCDVCKKEIVEVYGEDDEVEIVGRFGTVWSEGDNRDVKKIDCCKTCFLGKVVPLLEQHLSVKFHDEPDYPRTFGPPKKVKV